MGAGSALARQAGQTFRRIIGDDSPNDEGLRCIWHQGRGGNELLSWEHAQDGIARQELSFYGKCVTFDVTGGVATGVVPASVATTHAGVTKLSAIVPDSEPSAETLEMAALLLESVPKPDTYTENLLERVRAAVAS